MMLTDYEVTRAASAMVSEYGESAEVQAAKYADLMLGQSNRAALLIWARIWRTIAENYPAPDCRTDRQGRLVEAAGSRKVCWGGSSRRRLDLVLSFPTDHPGMRIDHGKADTDYRQGAGRCAAPRRCRRDNPEPWCHSGTIHDVSPLPRARWPGRASRSVRTLRRLA